MDNPELLLAEEFLLHTGKNLFLTGKAGTGKTTFLRNVLKKIRKQHAIVAPTGVAAINAGGTTIHSLFQFPLTAFTPDHQHSNLDRATNRIALLKHLRYRKEKADLLRKLELLVIDEISMVRADLLDAIDFALQKTRRSHHAFGGVQLLVIGDLYQLAPVVKAEVWNILRHYYESPYFFDALSWKNSNPITIELKKVYRQSHQEFIGILNRMRRGETTSDDINRLNENFRNPEDLSHENYITLTTHNHKARKINQEKMQALSSNEQTYRAEISETFLETAYPAAKDLALKKGAQVMFLRNDPEGRYFNGKLAQVIVATKNRVEVKFENEERLEVEPVVWENRKYELNSETQEVETRVLGSFKQYPLRLAWAVTVHKSQGLTFDKMIVDLGDTFSPGQAYVALSRCTSLDGLILASKIVRENVMVNNKILSYHRDTTSRDFLTNILEEEKWQYSCRQILQTFDLKILQFQLEGWSELTENHKIPKPTEVRKVLDQALRHAEELIRTSVKFQRQLNGLIHQSRKSNDLSRIKERSNQAIHYFCHKIFTAIIHPVHTHLEELTYKSKVRKYRKELLNILNAIWSKVNALYQASFMDKKLYDGLQQYNQEDYSIAQSASTRKKNRKGATIEDTYSLFQAGNSVQDIAMIRGLKQSTIEGHLVKLIKNQRIEVNQVLEPSIISVVMDALQENEGRSLTAIKDDLPFEISYNQMRMIRSHLSTMDK